MAGTKTIASWSPPVVPFGTEVVTVLVGTDKQKFMVHKDLICASSKFFSSTFKGGYAETQSGIVKLHGVDSKLFGIFYRWLYSTPRKDGEDLLEAATDTQRQPDELLLDLYRMADYLLVPGLQLLAVEQVKALFASSKPLIPSSEFIGSLFENDEPKWMQKYLVKHISFWAPKSTKPEEWTKLFQLHGKLAAETATNLVINGPDSNNAYAASHPSENSNFDKESGLDVARLRKEARASDTKHADTPGPKVLARAQLLVKYRHLDKERDYLDTDSEDDFYVPAKRSFGTRNRRGR